MRTMIVWSLLAGAAAAGGPEPAVRQAAARGLKYLADVQAGDGRWEADGGAYRVAMTSLAGMALLMDGNTPTQGPYARQVAGAVDYLLANVQPTGLLGLPEQDNRYMHGHGFAMLFLSQVVGEEGDARRRAELVATLTKAVDFSGRAQTDDGGWGYASAIDGQGFDEGSVTVTQMQGLRACRNAGIPVPKTTVEKGVQYIEKCTTAEGVKYSLKTGGGVRSPITAAALACLFSAGEDRHPLAAKLQTAADKAFGRDVARTSGLAGHWHYAHYYYAQAAFRRGDAVWLPYRAKVVPLLLGQQDAGGAWTNAFAGPVYGTSLNLAILLLDSNALPIYQR